MDKKCKEMQNKVIKYLDTLRNNKHETLKVLQGPLSINNKDENEPLKIQVMILRAEVNQLDGIMDAIKTLL